MSTPFTHRDGELHVESVPVGYLAERFGTPTYVYSRAFFESRYRRLAAAFGRHTPAVRYAVKANSNIAVLDVFARLGAGFDIVSAGELERVLRAGGDPSKVVFSGVGKTQSEIEFALKLGIECFNVESAAELTRLIELAGRHGRPAPVSIRVNPNIDAKTHPYISTGLKENKFGVPLAAARDLYRQAHDAPELEVRGIDCHIGSQIADATPLVEAVDVLLDLADALASDGIPIRHLDLGGGFGVRYANEPDFDIEAYGPTTAALRGDRPLTLMIEPGRFLVANGGILLTQVEYLKPAVDADGPNFAVVDAAMNDLIRPSLYQAWHDVEVARGGDGGQQAVWDIVGPICESADVLARGRPMALGAGFLLAVHAAGAYGFAQSSNYNSRNRAAEIIVDGDDCYQVRRRETVNDQLMGEALLPAAPDSAPDSGPVSPSEPGSLSKASSGG